MKWISLIVGGIIIVGGIWLLMSPDSANSPAVEDAAMEETTEHDGSMEDGTSEMAVPAPGLEGSGVEEMVVVEEEPVGDPIFHALVEYTDDGFSPATVTIGKGETVRFVNNSSRDVWVGGDNHPTHTLYPERSDSDCLGTSFDTCRSLQAAEFWEFTFNHTGEWGYHNHVRARDGGTIVVAEQ